MFRSILFLFLCSLAVSAKSQQVDSMLAIYKDGYQQEKVYIHFDRSIYKKAETIWYKAYLLAGNELSDYSRNFYIDWYDNEGKLIKHTIAPVFESSARGQFEIPANYTGEWLHVKAYTKWMLNFDTAFLYDAYIRIAQPDNLTSAKKNNPSAVSANFFAEGGDIIAGTTTNIAFLANDKSGKPVFIRGAVFNSKKQLIDSFISVHDGMGVFALEAEANESYTCNWIDEYGTNHTTNLASVKNNGASLTVQQLEGKAVYLISRSKQASDNFKELHVVGLINQQEVYSVKINLSSKVKVVGEIKTDQLPTGILQLTVFDADWVPVAERIVFINNQLHEFFRILMLLKG